MLTHTLKTLKCIGLQIKNIVDVHEMLETLKGTNINTNSNVNIDSSVADDPIGSDVFTFMILSVSILKY